MSLLYHWRLSLCAAGRGCESGQVITNVDKRMLKQHCSGPCFTIPHGQAALIRQYNSGVMSPTLRESTSGSNVQHCCRRPPDSRPKRDPFPRHYLWPEKTLCESVFQFDLCHEMATPLLDSSPRSALAWP